ncbi:penicillin-binding protein [Fusarium austroafricanum]|uniref:Penicillin-binding protein n=1 Tax=Fusarium austroafricanum TaxID=2364996 RepID=A0A8H4NRM2_9HYPO|nr:penicillin-binding protein [Fusarium austroafricanum]
MRNAAPDESQNALSTIRVVAPRNATSTVLEDRLNKTNDVVGQICSLPGVPGTSIGVVNNGNVVHTFNYGKSDEAADIDMTSDTILGVGSVTKSFIAAGLSNLVDQGKVSWNTPVKQVLPEFEQINPFVEESLTISGILSHQSGLVGFGDMNMAFQGDGDMLLPKLSLFGLVKNFPAQFPLRPGWSYFVWGYALAGEVIQRLSAIHIREATMLQTGPDLAD